MQTIWKFPIEATDRQEVMMPADAEMLCIQTQGRQACIWARVDSVAPLTPRTIRVFGTGHPVESAGRLFYIGTFQIAGGALVFHAFEDAQ